MREFAKRVLAFYFVFRSLKCYFYLESVLFTYRELRQKVSQVSTSDRARRSDGSVA